MKPNFALTLSSERVRLLHRGDTGWTLIGEVPVSEDMDEGLADLRTKALSVGAVALRTRIILPDDQIKYMTLEESTRKASDVRAALDGATPYNVDELVFDFRTLGGVTHVAAVARETLEEAEAFATTYKFAPVAFAAAPATAAFHGEPFFGPTEAAADLLGPDEKVEREDHPVRLPEDPTPIEDRATVATFAGSAPSEAKDETTAPAPAAEQATPSTPIDDSPPATPDWMAEDPARASTENAADTVSEEPVFASRLKAQISDRGTKGPGGDSIGSALDALKSAPPPPPPMTDGPRTVPAREAGKTVQATARPTQAPGSTTARAMPPGAPAPEVTERLQRIARTNLSATRGAGLTRPGEAGASASQSTASPITRPPEGGGSAPAVSDIPAPPPAIGASLTPEGDSISSGSFSSSRAAPPAPSVTAPSIDAKPRTPVSSTEAPAAPATKPTASPRQTVFDKQAANQQAAQRGKPRYMGLILTVLLLLAMAAVAVWAKIVTPETVSSWFGAQAIETPVEIATPEARTDPLSTAAATDGTPVEAPTAPLTGTVVATAPDTLTTAAPQVAEPDLLGTLSADLSTGLDPSITADPPERDLAEAPVITPETEPGTVVSPAEAERFYASTGVWLRAPRLNVTLRSETLEFQQTAALAGGFAHERQAELPAWSALAPDRSLPAQLNPPSPDTVFARDERGFLLATPDGTLSPDGMLIVAGQPDRIPPTRPGTEPPPIVYVEPNVDTTSPEGLSAAPVTALAAGPEVVTGLTPPPSDAPAGIEAASTPEAPASADIEPAFGPAPAPAIDLASGPAPLDSTAPSILNTAPRVPSLAEVAAAAGPDAPIGLEATIPAAPIEPDVIVIAGQPSVVPPTRPGTALPEPEPELRADGRVVATPEGTVTSEGTIVFAGAPDLIPPTRSALPDTPAPEVAPAPILREDGRVVATAEGTVTPDGTIVFAGLPGLIPPTRTAPVETPASEVAEAPLLREDGRVVATTDGTVTPEGTIVFAGVPDLIPPTRTALPDTPAPEDTTELLREDGRVVASEEGTVTPEGTIVFSGLPPLNPPTRPATETPAATQDDASLLDEPSSLPGGVQLTDLRPAARPADFTPPEAPAPLIAFAGPRPTLRPADLAPAAQETPAPSADPADQISATLASIIADGPDPLATATASAVAIATRPDDRPSNFSAIVAAARDQQQEQPTTTATVVPATTVQPTGSIPATVAEAATQESVINLREINLIGVYGQPGNRRALMRLANGRYVRVQIGDSFDGGRVTAIGDDVINYVRGGRTIAIGIVSE